jgi:uncharacterized protein (TIGR02001 family)
MRLTVGRGLALWICLLPIARAVDLQGSLGASTDSVFRGLTQSEGDSAIEADGLASATHGFGGIVAQSVQRERRESRGLELIGYAGYQQPLLGDWSATLSAHHYEYPDNRLSTRYNYDELSLALIWREQVQLTLIASPDTYAVATEEKYRYGRGAAFAAEIDAHQPLPFGCAAEVGIGYYDLRQQIGAAYAYWSAGISRQWQSWQLSVRYIGTDGNARNLFGDQAGDRVVGAVSWFF